MSIALRNASKVIDKAISGIFPDEDSENVNIDKHNFYVRALKNKNLLKGDETGYFRHQHLGEDDRVFYTIKLGKKKGDYTAKISRIEYRGPLNPNGTHRFGFEVTGILGPLGAALGGAIGGPGGAAIGQKAGEIAQKLIKFIQDLRLQSRLEGEWERAAAKVVDAIGLRMSLQIA